MTTYTDCVPHTQVQGSSDDACRLHHRSISGMESVWSLEVDRSAITRVNRHFFYEGGLWSGIAGIAL